MDELLKRLRRKLGRVLYGAGYWLIHDHSAWAEPLTSHYSFVSDDVTPQDAAREAARLERATARGDFQSTLTFGDRHKPTRNARDVATAALSERENA